MACLDWLPIVGNWLATTHNLILQALLPKKWKGKESVGRQQGRLEHPRNQAHVLLLFVVEKSTKEALSSHWLIGLLTIQLLLGLGYKQPNKWESQRSDGGSLNLEKQGKKSQK